MHVRKLVISGWITADPFKILFAQKHFFQESYTCLSKKKNTRNTQATVSFFDNLNSPTITDKQMLSCEGKITTEECRVRFFKVFSLTKLLVMMGYQLNFILNSGLLLVNV